MYLVALVLFLVVLLTGCGGSDSPTGDPTDENGNDLEELEESYDPINFRVTSVLGTTHPIAVNFYIPMYEQIEEMSEGKITFDVFWSAEIVELGGETDALLNGIVDMAWPVCPTYEPTKYILGEVAMLPLSESDAEIGTKAWQYLLESDVELQDGKTYYQLMFEENGVKGITSSAISDRYNIGKVGSGFDSVATIQNMKLRTAARTHQLYAEAIGCTTVTMPGPDLFDGLSRGTIDAAAIWVADWPNYGLDQLFDYNLEGVNLGHFPQVFAMTQEKWDSLHPEVQSIILEAANDNYLNAGKNINAARDDVASNAKAEFVHVDDLPAGVSELLKDGIVEVWYQYIELLESEGHPGMELAMLWRDCVVQAGGTVPDEIMQLGQ